MKKLILALLTLTLLFAALSSCNLDRKLDGVELKFKQKIDVANELSFSAYLKTESNGQTNELNVECYKSAGEYAYEFASPNNSSVRYRRLYGDNKLYEFVETEGQIAGTYHITDGVSIESTENFLRQIEKNIMLATYATLILDGKKETLNDVEVYRYEITVDGNTYSLWYDNENLVKIAAVINSTNESGEVSTEKYEALFTNYKFDEVNKTPFERPGALYTESPVAFESWMGILGDFSKMSANWLK